MTADVFNSLGGRLQRSIIKVYADLDSFPKQGLDTAEVRSAIDDVCLLACCGRDELPPVLQTMYKEGHHIGVDEFRDSLLVAI